jgi:hypothetical protein
MVYMGTLFFVDKNNVGYVGFLWDNSNDVETQIRMHPCDIHIKNKYEYEFHTPSIPTIDDV